MSFVYSVYGYFRNTRAIKEWTLLCHLSCIYLTLCNPVDCSLPSSCLWDSYARILEWVVISYSRESS